MAAESCVQLYVQEFHLVPCLSTEQAMCQIFHPKYRSYFCESLWNTRETILEVSQGKGQGKILTLTTECVESPYLTCQASRCNGSSGPGGSTSFQQHSPPPPAGWVHPHHLPRFSGMAHPESSPPLGWHSSVLHGDTPGLNHHSLWWKELKAWLT